MHPSFKVYIAVSADGFIADNTGGVDWLKPYEGGADASYQALMDGVDAVVMGRRTYQQVLTFGPWPYQGKRCVVLTGQEGLQNAIPEVETFAGDVRVLAERLERECVRDVWVMGGAEAIRAFLAAGRVDILELFVIPELLGEGVRLFLPGTPRAGLELLAHEPFPHGMVRLLYRMGPVPQPDEDVDMT
jgi:dihydrofolate reductase